MIKYLTYFIVLLMGLFSAEVPAHHGPFQYDLEVEVKYEGVVNKHEFKNPHSLTLLEIRTESNATRVLSIHGDGPASLHSSGITGDEVKAGDRVTVIVSPGIEDPEHSALGHELVKEDGTIVPLSRGRVRN